MTQPRSAEDTLKQQLHHLAGWLHTNDSHIRAALMEAHLAGVPEAKLYELVAIVRRLNDNQA